MTVETFGEAVGEKDSIILDTRNSLAFGGAHVPGSLNIEARGELSVWSGWTIGFDEPVYLVLEDDSDIEQVLALLWRTGHTNVVGYLAGGIESWIMDGRAVAQVQQVDVAGLHGRLNEIQILDVRSESEREAGFIPGSKHLFVPEVREKASDILDKHKAVATYCASGFRASLAASILRQEGFETVLTVPGSWMAWKSAGYEVETQEKELASV
jgi:hydroxyacylglutathione hydrolase